MALTREVQSLGGHARAAKLSKRRRREIASLGGQAFAKAQRKRKREQVATNAEGQAA